MQPPFQLWQCISNYLRSLSWEKNPGLEIGFRVSHALAKSKSLNFCHMKTFSVKTERRKLVQI